MAAPTSFANEDCSKIYHIDYSKQVPLEAFSNKNGITSTSCPARRRPMAADRPAMPAPITRIFSGILVLVKEEDSVLEEEIVVTA